MAGEAKIPSQFWGQYYCDELLDALNDIRKAAALHREAMLGFQKECGARKDIKGAKFFKEEAAEALKEYRGACACIGHLRPDWLGDCPYVESKAIPPEIVPYVYRAHALASVRV